MYISPTSKNEINPSIKFYKNDEKDKDKESKEKDTTSLSQKLFNQKRYIKILPTKKLISRNNDYIKKNTHKVMIRNKSNMEHSIKFQSNDNSIIKNYDNLTNRTKKNLLNYRSEIYTPKHSKDQSSNNLYNKSKNETTNLNLKQKNFINNARKNNIFLKNFFESESTKDKNDALKNTKNKIFSFPVSPNNKKNSNNKIYPKNDLNSNDKMVKSFIHNKKHEIGFKNFSSNSSLNIFNNSNNETKIDKKLNSYNNIKKDEININLISKIQKDIKNKNKTHFNVINVNNKNIGSYLKKIYYKNNKYFNQNNEKNNNRNNNNNNYILINHLLLNDINITGNSTGNIIDKNLEKLKPKSSRNEKLKNNNEQKERIYFSNNENNDIMNHDCYISLSETNINYEGLDIKKKINFYKTKYNEYISPEETHFKAVDFIQKVEISKYNIK